MNEMLRYTIIRVILFVMGGFLLLGCSDEDDVDNSGGTSKYGLIRMAEEDYDSSNTSYILQDEEPDEVLFDSSKRKFKVNEPLQVPSRKNQSVFSTTCQYPSLSGPTRFVTLSAFSQAICFPTTLFGKSCCTWCVALKKHSE